MHPFPLIFAKPSNVFPAEQEALESSDGNVSMVDPITTNYWVIHDASILFMTLSNAEDYMVSGTPSVHDDVSDVLLP